MDFTIRMAVDRVCYLLVYDWRFNRTGGEMTVNDIPQGQWSEERKTAEAARQQAQLSDALFAVAESSANPIRKKLILERIEKLQMRLLGLLEMIEHDTDPHSTGARLASECIRDVAFIEAQARGLR